MINLSRKVTIGSLLNKYVTHDKGFDKTIKIKFFGKVL